MSLKGISDNPLRPTMKTVTSYMKVTKGDQLPKNYTKLFQELTTEEIPVNGRSFELLTLKANHNLRFNGASPEERDQQRLAYETETMVRVTKGNVEIVYMPLAAFLPYTSIVNDDGSVTRERLDHPWGVLLYNSEAEDARQMQIQDALNKGIAIEEAEQMYPSSKMMVNPKARFLVEISQPQNTTDAGGVTFGITDFVDNDEYYVAFSLETDNYVYDEEGK